MSILLTNKGVKDAQDQVFIVLDLGHFALIALPLSDDAYYLYNSKITKLDGVSQFDCQTVIFISLAIIVIQLKK